MNTDRDAWSAYAEREGLIRRDPAPQLVQAPATTNKFHASPVTIDGRRFASRKEGARYLELRLLEKTGAIADLECQPVFPLYVMEVWRSQVPIRITTVGKFTADFRYTDLATGEIVVEDTKSDPTKTEAYRLRKRLAEVIHGMTVRET
jgi:hypothetical protein